MKRISSALVVFTGAQAFFQTGTVMMMAVSVLAGRTVAPEPAAAGLPLALSVLGTFLGLFPASMTMKRIGRKAGLMLGTGIGMAGTFLIMAGMLVHDRFPGADTSEFPSTGFIAYSAGYFVFGLYQSFMSFLKFAAMESTEPARRSTALSWILAAGIPAAFLGPAAGLAGRDLIPGTLFLGCYVLLTAILGMQLALFFLIPSGSGGGFNVNAESHAEPSEEPPRPAAAHLRNPGIWAAAAASSFGFGVMVMLMSTVPAVMTGHGHSMGAATLVLQWHVLGMYIPSFFSGYLVGRFGAVKLILAGNAVLAVQIAAALQGTGMVPFAVSMILLGVGWNFMFVGGTNLLTEQYRPSEKNAVQAANDSAVYLFATASTYGAPYLESAVGWFSMNILVLPLLGISAALAIVHGTGAPRGKVRPSLPG